MTRPRTLIVGGSFLLGFAVGCHSADWVFGIGAALCGLLGAFVGCAAALLVAVWLSGGRPSDNFDPADQSLSEWIRGIDNPTRGE